jgi:predicted DCC family thiol-disulfide oxidoreductase YuxK
VRDKPKRASSVPDQILLYDGTCGLCAASVQFILRHERRHSLGFAPLEGQLAATVRARHPELDGVDSLVWIDRAGTPDESVTVRSRAVLRAAAYLGLPWSLAVVGRFLPAALLDSAYDWVARHRHRIIRGAEQCYLPPPGARGRFLD